MPWVPFDRIIQPGGKFQNAVYLITQPLLSYRPHNVIASTEVKIVVKKRDFWINLDVLTLVFIFILSWEGKYEIDRLLNVFDLIQRCFAFILESLKRIRDRCLGNRTFIHILDFPFARRGWSFCTRHSSRHCRSTDGQERQRQHGRVRNVAAVFKEPRGGRCLGERHVKGCGWEELGRKQMGLRLRPLEDLAFTLVGMGSLCRGLSKDSYVESMTLAVCWE